MNNAPDWKTCSHNFQPFFATSLKCMKCGATTMVSMDRSESKPIFAPAVPLED